MAWSKHRWTGDDTNWRLSEEAQKLRVALCYATSSHPMQLCAMHANYVNGQYTNCMCTKTMATSAAAACQLAMHVDCVCVYCEC